MWGSRREGMVLLCIALFCAGLLLQATAQEGFVSIDCGSTVNHRDTLGIDWVTDEGFTSTGENAMIDIAQANLGGDAAVTRRTLQTLRFFPGPASKNCYVLKVADTGKHIVRLTFLGGNLTSQLPLDSPPAFSVSLGSAYWQDVEVTDHWTPIVKEASFSVLQTNFPICFRHGSSGFPFVNSIEIRGPLAARSYQLIIDSAILTTIFRIDCGLKSGSPSVRYPDDPLDRIWAADPQNLSFPSFTNSRATADTTISVDENNPPVAALLSAWNASRISFRRPIPTSSVPTYWSIYYIALYFLEIGDLKSTDVRELDVYVDGSLVQDSSVTVTDVPHQAWTLGIPGGFINVTIVPRRNATVQLALLNAAEAYQWQTYNNSWSTFSTDAKKIEAIKTQFNLTQWQGDPCLVWPYDWVNCSDLETTGGNEAQIITLNLSDFNLSGPIPEEIGDLTALEELALDNNNLIGEIPDFTALINLRFLRLQNNKLRGPIPASLGSLPLLSVLTVDDNLFEGGVPARLQEKIDAGLLKFSAANNPFLCFGENLCLQPPSSAPSSPSNSDKKSSSSTGMIIGAVAGGVVVLLLALLLLYWKCLRNPAPKPGAFQGPVAPVRPVNPSQPKSFSWAEVTAATRSFSKLLGRGGYGDVYYGELHAGQKVAVKVNKGNTAHGKDQFLNEVSLLSRVHHRHLVSFVGYCSEGNHEILIYDFMAQGTLQDHITGTRNTNTGVLDWKTRLNILQNASKGIEYLHNSCTPPIIHRDIKTANILLTDQLVAKVSDFGISKPTTDEDRTRGVTTEVKGSFGYLDPLYFRERRLTQKIDVYSFGVVMLEVITGKPPTTYEFPNSRASNLLEWVQSQIPDGDIGAVTDPAMGYNYKEESVWKVTELALSCLAPNWSDRPDMARVLQELTNAMELETHQITENIYPSPSNLPPSAYDQYQRVNEPTRVTSGRGVSSRSSSENVATFSTDNIMAR